MKLKYLKELKDYFFDEILSMAIGWIAGLLAVQLVSKFFLKRSWYNAWGIFSKKVVVTETTFSMGEWLISAIFGFIVMKLVNKFFKRLFASSENISENISENNSEDNLEEERKIL